MKLGKLGVQANFERQIAFFENDTAVAKGLPTAATMARLAVRLEELGYAAVWSPEGFGRNPFVASSWLLANTSRLIVATGIATIYGRDPVASATAMHALNEQSGGRFLLGLGVSHGEVLTMRGMTEVPKPLGAMSSYLDAMGKLAYASAPAPEKPLVVLAALRDRMMALAARAADGAYTSSSTPGHTARARGILGPGKLLCVGQRVILEENPVIARKLARADMHVHVGLENYRNHWRELGFSDEDWLEGGSDRLIDSLVAWGDEAKLRRLIQEHHDAGADHVCIRPITTGGALDMRVLERLAPGRA